MIDREVMIMTTYSVNLTPQTYKRLSEMAVQENYKVEQLVEKLLEAEPEEQPRHDPSYTITLEPQTYKRLAERAAQENCTLEEAAAFLIEAQPTEHPHVIRREGFRGGKPIVRGGSIAVWLIVALWKAGDSLEYLHATYPHVKQAAFYDAVSYYFDHQAEIEQQIEDNKIENALKKHNATMTEDGVIKFNDAK
jgi:uncharacterized protein (DUF433 family)